MSGMNTVPVDVSKLTIPICVVEPAVKTNPEGEVKKDRDGNTQYTVAVSVGMSGGRRLPDVIAVTTVREPDGIAVGTPVRLVGLIARPWQMGDRSGLAFSAEAVVPAVSPGASLTNGGTTNNDNAPAPKPGKPGGA